MCQRKHEAIFVCLSTLAKAGAELHKIASLAGHKSIQTTMRYTHLERKRLSSVVSKTFGLLWVNS